MQKSLWNHYGSDRVRRWRGDKDPIASYGAAAVETGGWQLSTGQLHLMGPDPVLPDQITKGEAVPPPLLFELA